MSREEEPCAECVQWLVDQRRPFAFDLHSFTSTAILVLENLSDAARAVHGGSAGREIAGRFEEARRVVKKLAEWESER